MNMKKVILITLIVWSLTSCNQNNQSSKDLAMGAYEAGYYRGNSNAHKFNDNKFDSVRIADSIYVYNKVFNTK
jgi:hypothetical protein